MALLDGVPNEGEVVAGKYILRECLGEGGMGVVFLAEQLSLGRTVAIKLLQPALATCAARVRQFHIEAVAACRVKHPGSVAVIDCGTTEAGTPFLVMERVRGCLLSAVIAEEELPVPRAIKIVQQILRALKEAHAQAVIHADIKSDNVMIDRTSEGDAITLIDFGLARIDGRWEQRDLVSGTPEYMAPELVRGEPPTVATDLYGVGVILYELLTGQTPFAGGEPEQILRRQLVEAVVPPSRRRPDREIPAALDHIVLRALDKNPRARFVNAAELARALDAVYQVAPRVAANDGAAASDGGGRRDERAQGARLPARPWAVLTSARAAAAARQRGAQAGVTLQWSSPRAQARELARKAG